MDRRLILSLGDIRQNPVPAMQLFHEMEEGSNNHSIATYNHLLTVLRDAGHHDHVLEIFERMKIGGITPREGTYSIVLKACGLLGDVDRAVRYFEELQSTEGLEANIYTYNAVMDACVKCRAVAKARDYFTAMRSKGLQPNVGVYATMINACAVEAEDDPSAVETSNRLLQEMKDRQLSINAVAYTAAMKVHAVVGNNEAVLKLYQEMKAKKIRRDVVVYNTIFEALGNGKPDVLRSLMLYNQMLNERIQPNLFSFSLLLRVCAAAGDPDQATMVLKEMRRLRIRPAVITYNTIIRAYIRAYEENERTHALHTCRKLVKRMEAEGIEPDGYTYSLLITLCTRNGERQQGILYFKEMKLRGIIPNVVTYTAMIDLHEELGDPLEGASYLTPCFDLLREMEKQGVMPDSRVFASLFVACGRVRDVDRVKELVTKMKLLGIAPTCYVYTSLMHFWTQVGDIEQALVVFNRMMRDVKPDVVTFTVLLEALVEQDEIPSVLELLKKMRQMDVQPNDIMRQVMRRIDTTSVGEAELREIRSLMNTV